MIDHRFTRRERPRALAFLLMMVLLAGCGSAAQSTAPAPDTTGSDQGGTAARGAVAAESSAAMPTASNTSQPVSMPGDRRYQSEQFSFAYPQNWTLEPLKSAPGEAYILQPSGRTAGTNIVVLRTAERTDSLDQLQQELVTEITKPGDNANKNTGTISETARVQVAGQDAVRLRYAAKARTGQAFDGAQVALVLPSKEVLALTLTVDPTTDAYTDVAPLFDQVLQSIQVKAAQAAPAVSGSAASGERVQADEYTFNVPADWTSRQSQLASERYATYNLLPPGRDKGTRITIARIFNSLRTTQELEQQLTESVGRAGGKVGSVERRQLAGREALLVRYSLTNSEGQQVEGLSAALLAPFGDVEFTLSVFPGDDFEQYRTIFDQVLASVEWQF